MNAKFVNFYEFITERRKIQDDPPYIVISADVKDKHRRTRVQ